VIDTFPEVLLGHARLIDPPDARGHLLERSPAIEDGFGRDAVGATLDSVVRELLGSRSNTNDSLTPRYTFLLDYDYYHVCEYLASARQKIPG
jgi:hypothetical protein